MTDHNNHYSLQQLQSGDEEAFRNLVENYKSRVLNSCYRFVHDKHDAEDLAQKVFMEVYRSIKYFKDASQLSTWIYRIAVNASLDFLRKKKRKKRFGYVLSLAGIKGETIEIPQPAALNPQNDLLHKERVQILNQAIAALPENQQIAITLSKYEGLGNNEIAEIMALSISSVESLIYRAKKNLQTSLRDYYEKKLLL
jgi:RNA polymerase sigma-70 factor, ECF subfamily